MPSRPNTPFIMLYVPQLGWFQDFLLEKTRDPKQSLSAFLVDLIIRDLKHRGVISPEEIQIWENRVVKKSKRASKEVHKKFCLYLPRGMDFLKERIKGAAESNYSTASYVWNLFVKARELTPEQKESWREYFKNQQRGNRTRKENLA